MAYEAINLHRAVTHQNNLIGSTWEYQENVTVATMAASAYLNGAAGTLKKFDVIILRGSNGTALAQVTSNTGATPVTVGAFTALT